MIELTTSRSQQRQHDQGVLRPNHSATAALEKCLILSVISVLLFCRCVLVSCTGRASARGPGRPAAHGPGRVRFL